MAIVPTDAPMTSETAVRSIEQIAAAYPFVRIELLATTAFGRPIWAMSIGEGPRQVLYSGAYHANEWITATVLLKFAEDYTEAIQNGGTIAGQNARELFQYATIHIVPMVNPDGVDLVTGVLQPGEEQYERALGFAREYPNVDFPDGWKANLNGVDLNLQFPAGWLMAREIKFRQGYTRPGPRDYVGRSPLDQRESQALARYTEAVDPALVLAYHSQGKVIYWQFGEKEIPGARALGEEFSRLSGYELADTPFESSFAGYKDWFIKFFGRPGYTVEVGEGENPLPLEQFDEIYRDNLGILVTAALGLPGEQSNS